MKSILSSGKVLFLLIIAILLGAFLRFYHVGDWMHYELDQARDYKVVHTAVERGMDYLPLQGPRAAGNVTIANSEEVGYGGKTTLRLGPLFYYLEYISAKIFGDTPYGSIVLIIILSVASIFVFYLFIKSFFSNTISIGLTFLYSTSLFFVTYSRFGWNPNIIPFFLLLAFLALVKIIQKNKSSGVWLIVLFTSIAFLLSAHFLAFILIGVVSLLILIIYRPKIRLKYWIASLVVFISLNIPLIINDIKTNGENTKAFVASLIGSKKRSNHSFKEKVVKETSILSRYNMIILTGYQRAELPVYKNGKLVCDDNCKEGFIWGVLSVFELFIAFLFAIYFFLKRDTDNKSRYNRFILFIIVWFIVASSMFLSLSYDFAPRFFLIFAPLSIIFLGFILKAIEQSRFKFRKLIIYSLLLTTIGFNLFFVFSYFRELRISSIDENFDNRGDFILNEKTRVTYDQMKEIYNYIISFQRQNNFPTFIKAQSEYERVFKEFDYENNTIKRIPKDLDNLYENANYFIIIRTQSNFKKTYKKYLEHFNIIQKRTFGTMTVYHIKPKSEYITKKFAPIERYDYSDPKFSENVQVRYLWHQIFKGCRYNYISDKCE